MMVGKNSIIKNYDSELKVLIKVNKVKVLTNQVSWDLNRAFQMSDLNLLARLANNCTEKSNIRYYRATPSSGEVNYNTMISGGRNK